MSTAETLEAKYGADYFKSLRAKVKKPGFSSMDKERVKEISAKGVAARKAKRDGQDKQTEESRQSS